MREPTRHEVHVREDPPRGDLYELEQTTHFDVVDTECDEVVLTFRGEIAARLSTTSGLWDDYEFSGVYDVALAPDGHSVIVRHFGGEEEIVPIPQQIEPRITTESTEESRKN
jgi:hypothetical protein